MTQWTSAVGAPQLAKLLASQHAAAPPPDGAGQRTPAYRSSPRACACS
jgi:hypothetical protein